MRNEFNLTYLVHSLLFCLIATTVIQAQNSASENIEVEENRYQLTLQHTTIVVSNIAESKKFYTEILKLKDLNALWLPKNQIFLSLGNNLELHVGEVPGVEIKPGSINHFALSVHDLDNFLAYLKEQGVVYSSLGGQSEYEVFLRPDGVRQTFIQDPDGYWIEINDAI